MSSNISGVLLQVGGLGMPERRATYLQALLHDCHVVFLCILQEWLRDLFLWESTSPHHEAVDALDEISLHQLSS